MKYAMTMVILGACVGLVTASGCLSTDPDPQRQSNSMGDFYFGVLPVRADGPQGLQVIVPTANGQVTISPPPAGVNIIQITVAGDPGGSPAPLMAVPGFTFTSPEIGTPERPDPYGPGDDEPDDEPDNFGPTARTGPSDEPTDLGVVVEVVEPDEPAGEGEGDDEL